MAFLPKPGRTHAGLQVYGFGLVSCTVDNAQVRGCAGCAVLCCAVLCCAVVSCTVDNVQVRGAAALCDGLLRGCVMASQGRGALPFPPPFLLQASSVPRPAAQAHHLSLTFAPSSLVSAHPQSVVQAQMGADAATWATVSLEQLLAEHGRRAAAKAGGGRR